MAKQTVYIHPVYIWFSIYTYNHKQFFLELNQAITHSYSSIESAIEALNYQIA
jgi:hypothetical protein